MEVYIFKKHNRCPYLNYGFYNPVVKQYLLENLDWNRHGGEHQVNTQFLYKWLNDLQRKQPDYLSTADTQQGFIYNHAIEQIQEIISVAESVYTRDWFEVYITRF